MLKTQGYDLAEGLLKYISKASTLLALMINMIILVVVIKTVSQIFFFTRKESRKMWLTYSCSGVGSKYSVILYTVTL